MPGIVLVFCPGCAQLYVADFDAETDELDAEDRGFAAARRLDGECPDHAHAFTVED